jgi:hypothetical protein
MSETLSARRTRWRRTRNICRKTHIKYDGGFIDLFGLLVDNTELVVRVAGVGCAYLDSLGSRHRRRGFVGIGSGTEELVSFLIGCNDTTSLSCPSRLVLLTGNREDNMEGGEPV